MILMYLDFGKVISEKLKSGWGESIVDNLSKDLQAEFNGVKGCCVYKSVFKISSCSSDNFS